MEFSHYAQAPRNVADEIIAARSGFSPLQRQDYQTIIRFEQQAAAHGVARL
jgi:hypothetical protein